MARPRSIQADMVQTFHCSYSLRAAIERASLLSCHGNTSQFIRQTLEQACRRELGEENWRQIEVAGNREVRQELLRIYLDRSNKTREARDTKMGYEAASGKQGAEKLQQWLKEYVREFREEMRRPEVDFSTCVALEEAADAMLKIGRILAREKLESSGIRKLQRLAAKFPAPLRAALNAAILNRVGSL